MNTVAALNYPVLFVLIVLTGLLPLMMTIITSYCKIMVVMFLVRNALGVQQVPPTMVMTGLAIILSVFVMAPVGKQTYAIMEQTPVPAELNLSGIARTAEALSGPLKKFLQANTDEKISKAFLRAAAKIWPADMRSSIDPQSMVFVIPSFVITELTKAFQIGFLLYLPFIAIDLIISNILLSMGMMMVSPMTISLPFKLMLFVTLDGWLRLSQGLMYSYGYG